MFDRKLLLQHISNIPKDITEQAKEKEPKYLYDYTQGTHKNMLERNVDRTANIYTTYHEALRHIHDNAPEHVQGDPASVLRRADYFDQPFHVVELSGNRVIKMPRAYDLLDPNVGYGKMKMDTGSKPSKPKPDPSAGPQSINHPKYDNIRHNVEFRR